MTTMPRNPTLRPSVPLPHRHDIANSAARIFYGCLTGSAVLVIVAIIIL